MLVAQLFLNGFQAGGSLLTRPVDYEMARDGKEPSIEFGFAIVLLAALHHANPGFLEDVFSEFAVAGEKDEISQQSMLIPLDQTVE